MFFSRMALSSLVISLAFSTACGGSGEDKAKQAGDGTLLTPYLAIGDTLAADKLDHLPELGAQVIAAAEGRESEPGVDAIVQGAGRVGAQDIQTARTAYKKMSDGMLQYLAAHPEQKAGHQIVH